MPTKMTLFFNQGPSGFSETYYHNENDPAALALQIPNSLYQAAVEFRHTSTVLKAARFSRVGPPRFSYLIRPYPQAQGTRGTVNEPGPDVTSTDAVYLLQSSAGASRRVFVRGLADVDVRRDIFSNDLESAALRNGRNAYFLALNQAGFQIQWQVRPPNGGLAWRRVRIVDVSLNPLTADMARFIFQVEGVPFVVGDMLAVNGVPASLPYFPRKIEIIKTLFSAGFTEYTFSYRLPGGVQVAPKNLRLTTYQVAYATITRWEFERFSEHKTGRPFGSLRGRASGARALR